jgi:hypothetical protein
MPTLHIYDNATGAHVASHTGADNAACEAWADDNYGSNDHHWTYVADTVPPGELAWIDETQWSESESIERALRIIDGYVGDGDPLPDSTTPADLLARVRAEWPDHADELAECGEWAVGIALGRHLR